MSKKPLYHDGTDSYASSADLYIRIERVSRTKGPPPVEFKAAITNYDDTVTANWNDEPVFGKMDPIATYQNTQRSISISWDVIAFGVEEAKENLEKVSRLQKFLYPAYQAGSTSATSMVDSPLIRMRFLNFMQGSPSTGSSLMGYVKQFSYKPVLEHGYFHANSGLIPKKIEVGCDLSVLHEEELGWEIRDGGEYVWRGRDEFPFNVAATEQTTEQFDTFPAPGQKQPDAVANSDASKVFEPKNSLLAESPFSLKNFMGKGGGK